MAVAEIAVEVPAGRAAISKPRNVADVVLGRVATLPQLAAEPHRNKPTDTAGTPENATGNDHVLAPWKREP